MKKARSHRHAGRLAHFVGNVLLGLSLGLFSYYGITDLLATSAQAGLQDELTALGSIALAVPPIAEEPEDPTGFEGWSEEDLAYWRELEPGGIFGRLVIPKMEMDVIVVKGTDREHLKKGPGWIHQTDPPGPFGNAGISGHRTTYGAPFRQLEELELGDTIQFYSPFRRYTYEVTEQLVVVPDRMEVVASTEDPTITLTACHPPYSAKFRLVVHGRLTEVHRLEDPEGSAGG